MFYVLFLDKESRLEILCVYMRSNVFVDDVDLNGVVDDIECFIGVEFVGFCREVVMVVLWESLVNNMDLNMVCKCYFDSVRNGISVSLFFF